MQAGSSRAQHCSAVAESDTVALHPHISSTLGGIHWILRCSLWSESAESDSDNVAWCDVPGQMSHTSVSDKNIPFLRALAMQSTGRNFSAATDLVFWRPIFSRVLIIIWRIVCFTDTGMYCPWHARVCLHHACVCTRAPKPEGGMIRLETLIKLKFLNSIFSSVSSYWNLINSSLSSNSRQRYPPPWVCN